MVMISRWYRDIKFTEIMREPLTEIFLTVIKNNKGYKKVYTIRYDIHIFGIVWFRFTCIVKLK